MWECIWSGVVDAIQDLDVRTMATRSIFEEESSTGDGCPYSWCREGDVEAAGIPHHEAPREDAVR